MHFTSIGCSKQSCSSLLPDTVSAEGKKHSQQTEKKKRNNLKKKIQYNTKTKNEKKKKKDSHLSLCNKYNIVSG